MGLLQILLIAFFVVVLLKLWDSEITITLRNRRIGGNRKMRDTLKYEEQSSLPRGGTEDEETRKEGAKRLKG